MDDKKIQKYSDMFNPSQNNVERQRLILEPYYGRILTFTGILDSSGKNKHLSTKLKEKGHSRTRLLDTNYILFTDVHILYDDMDKKIDLDLDHIHCSVSKNTLDNLKKYTGKFLSFNAEVYSYIVHRHNGKYEKRYGLINIKPVYHNQIKVLNSVYRNKITEYQVILLKAIQRIFKQKYQINTYSIDKLSKNMLNQWKNISPTDRTLKLQSDVKLLYYNDLDNLDDQLNDELLNFFSPYNVAYKIEHKKNIALKSKYDNLRDAYNNQLKIDKKNEKKYNIQRKYIGDLKSKLDNQLNKSLSQELNNHSLWKVILRIIRLKFNKQKSLIKKEQYKNNNINYDHTNNYTESVSEDKLQQLQQKFNQH